MTGHEREGKLRKLCPPRSTLNISTGVEVEGYWELEGTDKTEKENQRNCKKSVVY